MNRRGLFALFGGAAATAVGAKAGILLPIAPRTAPDVEYHDAAQEELPVMSLRSADGSLILDLEHGTFRVYAD